MKLPLKTTLFLLALFNPTFGQERMENDEAQVSPTFNATSSYRIERELYDFNGDGWCDLWCNLFRYEPGNDRSVDTDGDGVTDYDEMIHWRNPLEAGLREDVRTDAELAELERRRLEAALRQPKPVPPPSTRWKTSEQVIDLAAIRQREDLPNIDRDYEHPVQRSGSSPAEDPLGDADCDGLTNLQELAQGLPPLGANTGLIPGVCETFVTVGGEDRVAVDFRVLELPDLTYGYQVQESVDLQNWNDVDMYANRTNLVNTSDTGGSIDIATVHTNLSPATYPKAFMRLQFHNSWPPQPLEYAYVNLSGLVSHARDNTLTILPDNTLHKKIFDAYSSTNDSEWARFSWTNRLDLTGVAFDTNRTCTLISPRHVLMAAHFNRQQNDIVKFHTKDGTLVTRTITSFLETETIGSSANGFSGRDIAVGILDSAINDVSYYKVLPPRTDWPTYLTDALAEVTRFNNREVIIRRASTFSGGANGTRHLTFSVDTEVPSFYEGFANPGGDSGNPSFILVRGEPVLTHILSVSTTKGPFLGDPEIYNIINQFMSQLGGGHQLTSVYLNP